MFYSLKGILTHVEPSFFVVECGGVGYKCYTTLTTQRSLPKMGQEIKVYTYVHVREDAMDIYGFATVMELNCYKMLTGVSGVGPKVGLAILSELTPEQVATSIATNDSKALTRAAGVGPKLAQRIVLELTDKVKKMCSHSKTRSGICFLQCWGGCECTDRFGIFSNRCSCSGGEIRQCFACRGVNPLVIKSDGRKDVMPE